MAAYSYLHAQHAQWEPTYYTPHAVYTPVTLILPQYHHTTVTLVQFGCLIRSETIESMMYVIAHKALGVNMECLPMYPYS